MLRTTSILCAARAPASARAVFAQADQSPRRHKGAPYSRARTVKGDRSFKAASIPAAATAHEQGEDLPRALSVLSRYRALVLDSAYRPIDVVNWQRAITLDILQKADVLEYYQMTISSVSEEWYLPAVIRARWYGSNLSGRVTLSRRNILIRDKFSCVYCGACKNANLTLDHVIPASKGGANSWANLVTACSACNHKKGSKTLKELKWKLKREPREPSPFELDLVLASIGAGTLAQVLEQHPEWTNYLIYHK